MAIKKKENNNKIIGFWNYTVVLTYMSLGSAFVGMVMAVKTRIMLALIFLAFSGLCDAFDGRIARLKKDRTDSEKLFGMQLDSLCDVICFGFLPVIICYQLGVKSIFGMLLMVFYLIAAVARLAYFNVLELKRSSDEESTPHGYRGLPVTSIAVIFPALYFISIWFPFEFKTVIWELMLLLTGGLFITNIRIKKPALFHILAMTLIVAALFAAMILMRIKG